MSVSTRNFGKTEDGKEITLYSITNSRGARADVINLGAVLVSLVMPNDKGEFKDVVLGYDNVPAYVANPAFFGGTIGPSANRVAGARYKIDGVEYELVDNDGGNNLHTDFDIGFHKQVFEAEVVEGGVKFTFKKPDMMMGIPGNTTTSVTYSLSDDNELKLEYEGISDKKTIFNVTNHTYFALGGHDAGPESLLNTELMIKASRYTEIVPGAIPTGKLPEVTGTPMDFRTPKKIGQDIDSDMEQMVMVNGYDHNFAIDDYDGTMRLVASASYDGRTMEIYSDLPGIQFYSGNGMGDHDAKDGKKYHNRYGFCMETQYFPNSVNEESFISPVRDAGERYHTVTIYKFK